MNHLSPLLDEARVEARRRTQESHLAVVKIFGRLQAAPIGQRLTFAIQLRHAAQGLGDAMVEWEQVA